MRAVSRLISTPVRVKVNPPNKAFVEGCSQAAAVQLSAAQTKARLRQRSPISSPLLYRSMRITNAVLFFKVVIDPDGNVVCIRVVSGHPLVVGAAIESIKTWKFLPTKVQGQRLSMRLASCPWVNPACTRA
jgi:hypothetical protein